jgi:hypothetical protein
MRLWTIHPQYLDAKGLVAAWREALLAQKVLAGGTRGYRRHPQLVRFQIQRRPVAAIAAYLRPLAAEASARGYQFDTTKIVRSKFADQLEETTGQMLYEWQHLKGKLRNRAPHLFRRFKDISMPDPHPMFRIVSGPIRDWEKR